MACGVGSENEHYCLHIELIKACDTGLPSAYSINNTASQRHHQPIEESKHRHNDSREIGDAMGLDPKRIEHNPARIERHCHDEQHPPAQEQGVFG